ncbi:hypothetical protein BOTCAL_0053g00220 [Botryotinia calthae]|uniref:Uncharacterized protein n=1 Tax=Botryotinia calthae TaxID=38488 RepID=A0A4Y8DD70_9HELO|nr:hypothetical protein BOTCAL_0053g00220 [Botryotinia calthae]
MAPRVFPLLQISLLGIIILILRFTILPASTYVLELRTPIVSIGLSLDRWQFFTFRIEHRSPINTAKIHSYGIKIGLLRSARATISNSPFDGGDHPKLGFYSNFVPRPGYISYCSSTYRVAKNGVILWSFCVSHLFMFPPFALYYQ